MVVQSEEATEKKEPIGVDGTLIEQAMKDGNGWFEKNPSLRSRAGSFIFLRAERYRSFREKLEGRFEDEPAWYNEGVQLLKEWQGKSGGWGEISEAAAVISSPVDTDPPVSTAFAMLFLLRQRARVHRESGGTGWELAGRTGIAVGPE